MKKHADVLRPKFEIVLERFEKEFGGLNIAKWTKPKGGYFISLNLSDSQVISILDKFTLSSNKLTIFT